MGARVVTVNDVLDGHVALDIQCLDRIYLNAYVPKLQSRRTGIGSPRGSSRSTSMNRVATMCSSDRATWWQ